MSWFAVRHVVRNGRSYEERITLWQSENFDAAIESAQTEAKAYCELDKSWQLLDLWQAFELEADAIADGAEVFSLIRESALDPEQYINRFFATGTELQSVE